MHRFRPLAGLLAATALALASTASLADTLRWRATSYLVKQNPDTGEFQRRGIAMFDSGDIATFVIDGRVTRREGPLMAYAVAIEYRFEDGSTLRQEGEGQNNTVAPGRVLQSGKGRLLGGTGRYEGVAGPTESTGRQLNAQDSFGDFKAEVATLPRP